MLLASEDEEAQHLISMRTSPDAPHEHEEPVSIRSASGGAAAVGEADRDAGESGESAEVRIRRGAPSVLRMKPCFSKATGPGFPRGLVGLLA